MESYLKTHGPAEACKSEDGTFALLPPTAPIDDVIEKLGKQEEAITAAGGEHQTFPEADAHRKSMEPIASLKWPGAQSAAWLFDKHPPLATVLNMLYAQRRLQVEATKSYRDWTGKDVIKDEFLADGFGGRLGRLDAAVGHALTFKAGANEAILKLQGASEPADFAECLALAQLLVPVVKQFLTVLKDC